MASPSAVPGDPPCSGGARTFAFPLTEPGVRAPLPSPAETPSAARASGATRWFSDSVGGEPAQIVISMGVGHPQASVGIDSTYAGVGAVLCFDQQKAGRRGARPGLAEMARGPPARERRGGAGAGAPVGAARRAGPGFGACSLLHGRWRIVGVGGPRGPGRRRGLGGAVAVRGVGWLCPRGHLRPVGRRWRQAVAHGGRRRAGARRRARPCRLRGARQPHGRGPVRLAAARQATSPP